MKYNQLHFAELFITLGEYNHLIGKITLRSVDWTSGRGENPRRYLPWWLVFAITICYINDATHLHTYGVQIYKVTAQDEAIYWKMCHTDYERGEERKSEKNRNAQSEKHQNSWRKKENFIYMEILEVAYVK